MIADDNFAVSSEDGMVHLFSFGEFPANVNGKTIVQILDKAAAQRLVDDINRRCQQPNSPGILVDFDHGSEDSTGSTRAAGWITSSELRDDGVWVNIRWSGAGRQAIQNGDYRLVSPVFTGSKGERDGMATFEPTRLVSVALCNAPNIKGSVPITNRQVDVVKIQNRVAELQRQFPSLGLATAYNIAQSEDGGRIPITRLAHPMTKAEDGAAIRNRAIELAQRPGTSLASAYLAAQREGEAQKTPSGFAEVAILGQMQTLGFEKNFSAGWLAVCNRLPALARMANRQAGWDALSDLEPIAHDAYMSEVNTPKQFPDRRCAKFDNEMRALARANPDLGHEGRWQLMKQNEPGSFWKFVLSFAPSFAAPRDPLPAQG